MNKAIAVFVFPAFLANPAVAADYTVRQEDGKAGACYHNGKFRSPVKFCHNCKKRGGNKIIWNFRVFCEGKPTSKTMKISLPCKRSIPDESEQLKKLYADAKELMDDNLPYFYGWRDCNLGGWKQ